MKRYLAAACSLSCLVAFAGSANADQIVLDFEAQTADSSDVPAGWSYVDSGLGTSGTYVTSAAGAGSPDGGLAGVLVSTNPTHGSNLPHSFLVNSGSPSGFDITKPLSGSYDFRMVHTNNYDSAGFLFGDIKSGVITGTDAGQLLMMSQTNGGFGQINAESRITDGSNDSTFAPQSNLGFSDDIWYRVAFTWTPTSGTTGDFSYTATRWDSNALTFIPHSTFGITGHTFNKPEAYVAIADMWATSTRFDNITVTGTFINTFDPADLDQDGDVDDADFGIAFAAFTGPGGSSNSPADLDNDGDVDDADFGIAFAAFTGPGGGDGVVPEPTSLALISLAGLIATRRRRA